MSLQELLENNEIGEEVSGKQGTSEFDIEQQTMNDDDDIIDDPEYMATQFSSSILVQYFYDQLENPNFDEPITDQLNTILIRLNIVLAKFKDNPEYVEKINQIKRELLNKVVENIDLYYDDFSLEDFGLDPNSENYENEVIALYEFFFVNRIRNITKFFTNYVLINKKAIIEAFKNDIPKANQTFRELKKRSDTRIAYLVIASALFVENEQFISNIINIETFKQLIYDEIYFPDTLESVAEYIDGKELLMQYIYKDMENNISSIATEVRSEIAAKVLEPVIETEE